MPHISVKIREEEQRKLDERERAVREALAGRRFTIIPVTKRFVVLMQYVGERQNFADVGFAWVYEKWEPVRGAERVTRYDAERKLRELIWGDKAR